MQNATSCRSMAIRSRGATAKHPNAPSGAPIWKSCATSPVDPACGSGAFLVAAFDFLAREYRGALARLEALEEPVEIDAFDEIVNRNLYGVDLNAESVEIT